MHSVGFEPTSTNTFELESNPLDRSGMNAVYHYTLTGPIYDSTSKAFIIFNKSSKSSIAQSFTSQCLNPHITDTNIYQIIHPTLY